MSAEKVLQRGVVQHGVSQQPLELGVLILERPRPLRLGPVHAPVLGLPGVEGGGADAMLAAHVGGLRSGLLLAQDGHDLLLGELRSLHRPALSSGRTQTSDGGENGGHSILDMQVTDRFFGDLGRRSGFRV